MNKFFRSRAARRGAVIIDGILLPIVVVANIYFGIADDSIWQIILGIAVLGLVYFFYKSGVLKHLWKL